MGHYSRDLHKELDTLPKDLDAYGGYGWQHKFTNASDFCEESVAWLTEFSESNGKEHVKPEKYTKLQPVIKAAVQAGEAYRKAIQAVSDVLFAPDSAFVNTEKDPNESSSPEQVQDLEKELGTEGTSVNEPDTKDTGMSEQERELRKAILGGMKEGPDERW